MQMEDGRRRSALRLPAVTVCKEDADAAGGTRADFAAGRESDAGRERAKSEATSFAAGRDPCPTSEPTAVPFAIAAWILPFEPAFVPRMRSVPSSQPSFVVVFTTLDALISTVPFNRGSLLVAVPV